MTHRFIVNTDNVNSYGYRILSNGIDTQQYENNPIVYYVHNRNLYSPTGSEVIGRATKLLKENNQLIAEIEFDKDDDFAKKIAGKVERGFIRMASLSADVIETSTAKEDLLPGQIYETVKKCKLIEISVVDIGGNDEALMLTKQGDKMQLKKIEQTIDNMNDMDLKKIALALGMKQDAEESAVLQKLQDLQLAKSDADKKVLELQKRIDTVEQSEANNLIDRAVELALLPEEMRETTLVAFKSNHEKQTAMLSKLVADKEKEQKESVNQATVRELVLNGGKTSKTDAVLTFDYLKKNNMVELRRIQNEDPEKYAQLVEDYNAGVRHVETK